MFTTPAVPFQTASLPNSADLRAYNGFGSTNANVSPTTTISNHRLITQSDPQPEGALNKHKHRNSHHSLRKSSHKTDNYIPELQARATNTMVHLNCLKSSLAGSLDKSTDQLLDFIQQADKAGHRKSVWNDLRESPFYSAYLELNFDYQPSPTDNFLNLFNGHSVRKVDRPMLQATIDLCKNYAGASIREMMASITEKPACLRSETEQQWLDFFNMCDESNAAKADSATVNPPVCAVEIPSYDDGFRVTCKAQKTSPPSTVHFESLQDWEWSLRRAMPLLSTDITNPHAIYLRMIPSENLNKVITCRQTTPGCDEPTFCNVRLQMTGDLSKCGAQMPTNATRDYPIITTNKSVYPFPGDGTDQVEVICRTAKTTPQPTIQFVGMNPSYPANQLSETQDGKEVYIKYVFSPHPYLNFEVYTCVQRLPGSEPKFSMLKLCVNGTLPETTSQANLIDRIRVSDPTDQEVANDQWSTDNTILLSLVGAAGVATALAISYSGYQAIQNRNQKLKPDTISLV